MKKRITALLLSAAILLFAGCATVPKNNSANSKPVTVDTSDMFTDRDMEIGYDEETAVKITLSGKSAECDSPNVKISDSAVTISDEGTYILSGALDDGQVIVNAEKTDKIQLVLNSVNITSAKSAPVYVLSADKVFITTAAETDNTLSNGGEYAQFDDNNIDSVIFSKSDLTLNGAGTLNINGKAGHGAVSKDDLVITSGTYNVTAENHGLSGKDSVRIANGEINITSGKDGIHSENADDANLGFIYIANINLKITSQGDGMSAAAYTQIDGGEYTIESGGASANAPARISENDFKNRGEKMSSAPTESTADDSASAKGIKSASDLIINNGTFNIDSADDSLHSNTNVTITGGALQIASGDDGIHADSALKISGGAINITKSYEGIEGLSIEISGGETSLVADDDGLNAAGGNDSSGFGGRGNDIFTATDGAYIKISGGKLTVNASGDGVDSNGSLEISGGETYVSGPTNSGNGTLDYNGDAVISGGIFVGAGASGMAQNFGSSSTQGAMLVTVNQGNAGDTISLKDNSGKEIISWKAEKAYSCVIVSCPEITKGSTYSLTTGSNETSVTMDSLIYGACGMGGGKRRNMAEPPNGAPGEKIDGMMGEPPSGEKPAYRGAKQQPA